jgi:superfamily II DNA or RNA helicase
MAVTEKLDAFEWSYSVEDKREFPATDAEITTKLGDYELRDYQTAALEEMLVHGRGVVSIATGGGKSLLGAAFIKSVNLPTVWVTHRKNLLYQTQERLQEYLGEEVGVVGDGKRDIRPVTVCMVQTLDMDKNKFFAPFLKNVKVMICDEVHHLASLSDQWYRNVTKIHAPYRFGLTATPNFEGHGIKLVAQTGGCLYKISTQELLDKGVLVPPYVWIIEVSKKHCDFPKKTDSKEAYKRGVVLNSFRTAQTSLAVQELPKPCIVLVRYIEHGEMVLNQLQLDKVQADFLHGKVGQTQRNLMLSALENGLLDCLVAQVEILGEGTDLPWLRSLVNATGNSGGGDGKDQVGRQTIQILGRILRRYPGKTRCDIVDFADATHPSLAKASDARIATYIAEGHGERIDLWCNFAPPESADT